MPSKFPIYIYIYIPNFHLCKISFFLIIIQVLNGYFFLKVFLQLFFLVKNRYFSTYTLYHIMFLLSIVLFLFLFIFYLYYFLAHFYLYDFFILSPLFLHQAYFASLVCILTFSSHTSYAPDNVQKNRTAIRFAHALLYFFLQFPYSSICIYMYNIVI